MLKVKLQYFGHLMHRADSLEKILMLGKAEGKRRRWRQRMGWWGGRLKRKRIYTHIGRTDAEAEAPVLWPPDAKS